MFRTNFNFVFRENFAKLMDTFAKHEIDNFAKFLRKHENENFRSHPTSETTRQSTYWDAHPSVALAMHCVIRHFVSVSALQIGFQTGIIGRQWQKYFAPPLPGPPGGGGGSNRIREIKIFLIARQTTNIYK